MNKIDYKLDIIGEGVTYQPRSEVVNPIVSSKNKIFEITADNSYGKTFILNLIAYALEGDKLDDTKILSSIKDSIVRYDDSDSYGLEYEISLELPDNKELSLSKKKDSNKIITIDGGPPIGHSNLHKDLSIIYDVPSNPSERLNAVIKDLGGWNNNLISKFQNLIQRFSQITRDFDNIRDENKIKDLEKGIKIIDKAVAKKITEKQKEEKLRETLIICENLSKLKSLFKDYSKTHVNISKKTKELKSLKKPSKTPIKDKSKIRDLSRELADTNKDFRDIVSKLIKYVNSNSEISKEINEAGTAFKDYENVKEFDLENSLSSEDYVSLIKEFQNSLDFIKDTIIRVISKEKGGRNYLIHNSYQKLFEILNQLIDKGIDDLLSEATSVQPENLKKQLKLIIQKHEVKNYNEITTFLNNDLTSVKELIGKYIRKAAELKEENEKQSKSSGDSKYYTTEAELNSLKNSWRLLKNEFDILKANCANDLDIKDLDRLDSLQKISDIYQITITKVKDKNLLEDLKQSISKQTKIINEKEDIIVKLQSDRILKDISLNRENEKLPSTYDESQKDRIKSFLKISQIVNRNLGAYKGVIGNIENGNLHKFKNENDKDFIELAGKIIAYSMDNKLLRADGIFSELKFYDMIKQQFHCSDGIVINKADVSTGLASANYLKQRIENIEGKYVVVLLDEIGNMAQNAIDKVVDSIKKLENNNRLVLAIFTRPNSDGIQIIEY